MDENAKFSETIILITREGMGYGEPALQITLLDTYLRLLIENKSLPAAICFYTEGVKLVVEGSPLLARLGQIEKSGVSLIVCSTCLNYYHLVDKVKAGIIGGMPDIIEAQSRAEKVITI